VTSHTFLIDLHSVFRRTISSSRWIVTTVSIGSTARYRESQRRNFWKKVRHVIKNPIKTVQIQIRYAEGDDGVFLVRESNSSPGDYVLSVLHEVRWILILLTTTYKLTYDRVKWFIIKYEGTEMTLSFRSRNTRRFTVSIRSSNIIKAIPTVWWRDYQSAVEEIFHLTIPSFMENRIYCIGIVWFISNRRKYCDGNFTELPQLETSELSPKWWTVVIKAEMERTKKDKRLCISRVCPGMKKFLLN
jgi:hypothetical protein